MTQPIQEPTLARTDSRLTWGQNQLFRRPAPTAAAGGSSGIFASLYWFDGVTVLSNDEFSLDETPSEIFTSTEAEGLVQPGGPLTSFLGFQLNTALTDDSYAGSWLFKIVCSWIDSPPASGFVGIETEISNHGSLQGFNTTAFEPANPLLTWGLNGAQEMTTEWLVSPDAGPNAYFSGIAFNVTPVSLDLNAVYMEIVKLADYSGGEFS